MLLLPCASAFLMMHRATLAGGFANVALICSPLVRTSSGVLMHPQSANAKRQGKAKGTGFTRGKLPVSGEGVN